MNYKLEDLLDLPLLQNLQEKLDVIYSFPSAIIDTSGKILTAVSWQEICTKFHRTNPQCNAECVKSDQYILEHIHEANPSITYKCPHGFVDNAFPIIIGGRHLGNFFIGQFFLEPPDPEFFREQAKIYGFNENDYLDSVSKVPVWRQEKLTQYLDFIKGFIEIIAGIGLKNLREIETIGALKKSEERYKAIVQSTSDWIWEVDAQGKYVYCSAKVEQILGYAADEIIGKTPFDFMPPDRVEEVRLTFLNLVATNSPIVDLENWNVHKNGHRVCLLTNGIPVIDEFGNLTGYKGADKDITERKTAEKKFRESEEMFRLAFMTSLSAFYVATVEGEFIEINTVFEEIFGYNRKEVIGKSSRELNLFYDFNDRSKLLAELNEKGYAKELEMKFRKKNGEIIICNFSVSIAMIDNNPFTIGAIIDITNRKNDEKRLILLSKAVEQSPVSVVITGKNGNIEYVNPRFSEVTGYAFNEVSGKNPRILRSGFQRKGFYKELWSRVLSGNIWHGEICNKRKDGQLYWESVAISPILDKIGGISSFVAVSEDISEKKRMIDDLLKAKEKAEESDRLKTAFLANMSHEIRTPMNGILGFTELLKEPKLSGKDQFEYIRIIEKSGARMLNIINDLISISKVESGQMDVSIAETNIHLQMEYILSFFKLEAEQKGITLSYKNSIPETDWIIKTDKEKVYAILTNLVKNALKFTHDGSIEIGCDLKKIIPSFDGKPLAEIKFFVKDTGVGIPKKQKHFIFERFRQGSEALNRRYEGAGLGLSISRAYVEILGGKIWVESKEGKGSTFHFTIPVHNEPEEMASSTRENWAEPENRLNSTLKILIAEDDLASEKFITRIVRGYSREIINVQNGIEAVEACLRVDNIDLILMDMKMPEMDGYQATRQIRKFNKDVIIIAQTAFALAGDREKTLEAGCNDCISKPIQKDKLLKLIQAYFN